MDVVKIGLVVVAALLGGGVFFGISRAGAGAWTAFTLGLVMYGLVMLAGPGAWHC